MTQLEIHQAQQDLNRLNALKSCTSLSLYFLQLLDKEIQTLEMAIRNAKIAKEQSKK